MKKPLIHLDLMVPAPHQATKMTDPRQRSLHFPTARIAPQLPAVLHRGFLAVCAMWTDQVNTPIRQTRAQGIRVTGLVIQELLGLLPRSPSPRARHRNYRQGLLHQRYFGGGRRCQEVSHRNTLAVDHHQPLRTFALLGFADTGPLFFAGAKLPSAKVSAQSSWPWASSAPKKARHALS